MQPREAEVSRWSTSTESDSADTGSARSEQSRRSPSCSPFNVSMSETRDNALAKIRSFVKSPATKKNNEFQPLPSAPNSFADIQNPKPPTPPTMIPTTRTVRSGRTIISRDKSSDVVAPTNVIKGLRKPAATAKMTSPKRGFFKAGSPKQESYKMTSPKTRTYTPPPTPPTSSPATKSPKSPSSPSVPCRSFELTPLSTLIQQSYADIAVLRRKHTLPSPTLPASTYSPHTSPKVGLAKHPKEKETQQVLIDFDKIEGNLKNFEEIYNGFLRCGGKQGEEGEEVHLIAVVCKRSDVVRGNMGEGEGVPKVKRTWVDCGF